MEDDAIPAWAVVMHFVGKFSVATDLIYVLPTFIYNISH